MQKCISTSTSINNPLLDITLSVNDLISQPVMAMVASFKGDQLTTQEISKIVNIKDSGSACDCRARGLEFDF